jgi:hypothetical protein
MTKREINWCLTLFICAKFKTANDATYNNTNERKVA